MQKTEQWFLKDNSKRKATSDTITAGSNELKQEVHGPKKQFQSVYTFAQSYGYTTTNWESNFFLELDGLYMFKLESPNPGICCVKFILNWPTGSREHFKNLSMHVCNFVIISFWKGLGPSFEQCWLPLTFGCFVQSLVDSGE